MNLINGDNDDRQLYFVNGTFLEHRPINKSTNEDAIRAVASSSSDPSSSASKLMYVSIGSIRLGVVSIFGNLLTLTVYLTLNELRSRSSNCFFVNQSSISTQLSALLLIVYLSPIDNLPLTENAQLMHGIF